jgi:hypothetical protein
VVPANKKWYRNLVIARTVADTLDGLEPKPPKPSFDPKTVKIPD